MPGDGGDRDDELARTIGRGCGTIIGIVACVVLIIACIWFVDAVMEGLFGWNLVS